MSQDAKAFTVAGVVVDEDLLAQYRLEDPDDRLPFCGEDEIALGFGRYVARKVAAALQACSVARPVTVPESTVRSER